MLAHMRYQIRTLAERFQTDDAFVRFLACNEKKEKKEWLKLNYSKKKSECNNYIIQLVSYIIMTITSDNGRGNKVNVFIYGHLDE